MLDYYLNTHVCLNQSYHSFPINCQSALMNESWQVNIFCFSVKIPEITVIVRCLHTQPVSHYSGSHVMSSGMAHTRCVSGSGFHISRSWMSESFQSVWWNAAYTDWTWSTLPFQGAGDWGPLRDHVTDSSPILLTNKVSIVQYWKAELEPYQLGCYSSRYMASVHQVYDRLVGLVVKASASRAEDHGFESR